MTNLQSGVVRVQRGRIPGNDGSAGRERLLDAAVELFATRGIANTTIAQIGANARVTAAMVHYWFSTREKLCDAVVEERLVPHIRAVWEPADIEHDEIAELVRGLLGRLFKSTAEAPWLPSLWLREIIQVGGLLQERVLKHVPHERNRAFRDRIAAAQADGQINPHLDPDLLFVSMIAMVMLPLAAAQTCRLIPADRPLDLKQVEAHVMALLTDGLAVARPTTPESSRDLP